MKTPGRLLRWCALTLVAGIIGLLLLLGSPDPVSNAARAWIVRSAESHQLAMLDRVQRGTSTGWDRLQLHALAIGGIGLGYVLWPEAAAIVRHLLYGDGTPLVLESVYFARSEYLRRLVDELGVGDHGPLVMRQADDWRVSLAFNPFHLAVTADSATIYSPDTQFARPGRRLVHTVIPLGRLNLVIYDNLLGSLPQRPYRASISWARPPRGRTTRSRSRTPNWQHGSKYPRTNRVIARSERSERRSNPGASARDSVWTHRDCFVSPFGASSR